MKFDYPNQQAILRRQVSRTEEKNATDMSGSDDERTLGLDHLDGPLRPSGARLFCRLADESERARLIGDITIVIRDASMPEATRLAGLTLIGWLARRRVEEVPHAIGIDEARESEGRLRTSRPKAR